jgi:hypothetical protein
MKKNLFFTVALTLASVVIFSSCSKDDDPTTYTINFSNLSLAADTFWTNTSADSGAFTSDIATFSSTLIPSPWGDYYSSIFYSNSNNIDSAGYMNQQSVYTKTPNTNGIFAIVNGPCLTYFSESVNLASAEFALNTYAYLSMQNGDGFGKKFENGDWFKVTVTSLGANNEELKSLDIYLADYRDGKTIMLDSWTNFNLSSLGLVNKIKYIFDGSDKGGAGLNTPAYVCIDNIKYTKE